MEKMRARRWPIAAMILSGFSILLFPVHILLTLIVDIPLAFEEVIRQAPLFIGYPSCFIIVLFTRRNMRWLTLLPMLIIYGLEAYGQVELLRNALVYGGEDLRSIAGYYIHGTNNIFVTGLFCCMTVILLFFLLLLITRKKVFAILTTVFLGFGIVAAIVNLVEMPRSCWSLTTFLIAYILISFAILRVYPKPRKS